MDNADLKIERLELGRFNNNAYIVICPQTGKSVLVDVPAGAPTIIRYLTGTQLRYILLTHSHIDHIAGLRVVRSRVKAPLGVHPADNQEWLVPEILLEDAGVLQAGEVKIEVMHTPGHTPGSVCFKVGEYLLAGDTLFPGGPGRTSDPEAFKMIVRSITEKIFALPDDVQVYPGHGPPTNLKKAKEEYAVFAARGHAAGLCGDVLWATS